MKIGWKMLLTPLRWILIAVILFLIWQAWVFIRPKPRNYSVAEVNAIAAACRQTTKLLAQTNNIPTRFAVAHFRDDPGDHVTEAMREAIGKHPGWSVAEGSPINQFLKDIKHTVSEATSFDELIHAGRRVKLDAIVTGRLLAVEATNNTASATLRLAVYDTRNGSWMLRDTITANWSPTPLERVSLRFSSLSWGARFLIWLLPMLALPWITPGVTRRALEKSSNIASAVLIGFYVIISLVLGVGLRLFQSGAGGIVWWRFFLFFILYGVYALFACETIAKREKGN